MKYPLIFSTLAVLSLAACLPETPTATVTKDTTVDLTSFHAWPNRESTTVDVNAIGRDNMVFVIDRSGSMDWDACESNNSKRAETITALTTFIPYIPDGTAVGYIDFGTNYRITVPLETNNTAQLMAAAQNDAGEWGGTNLGAAIQVANEMLETAALEQSSTGTYRLVIITDGVADDSRKLVATVESINQTPVEIITAGFCFDSAHVLNTPEDTVYVQANNTDDLVALLESTVKTEATGFVVDFADTVLTDVTE
jgi:uncharacterized protein YegL